jgi:hypothetical protein
MGVSGWKLTLAAVLLLPALAAGSQIVVADGGYGARDFLPSEWVDTFSAMGDDVAVFSISGGLQIVDYGEPTVRQSWGKPSDYLAMYTYGSRCYVWSSFVAPDPSGQSVWVGFTMSNNTDDRIYQVDATGTWTQRATLAGNFDMQFAGGAAYVSANPGATQVPRAPANTIYRLDTTGSNAHDPVAQIGGYSTGLAIDADGTLYSATYYLDNDGDGLGPSDNKIVRFSAEQVASAIGPDCLAIGDAETVCALSAGACDVDADEGGHVVFGRNGGAAASGVFVWNEDDGGSVERIAAAAGTGTPWLTALDVTGDVTVAGGKAWVVDYWKQGIAEIVRLIPGDADGDGTVSESDAAILAAHWGQSPDMTWTDGDFNEDGTVGPADASLLAANWGRSLWPPGEGASVPEPVVGAMAVAAMCLGLAFHHRDPETRRRARRRG